MYLRYGNPLWDSAEGGDGAPGAGGPPADPAHPGPSNGQGGNSAGDAHTGNGHSGGNGHPSGNGHGNGNTPRRRADHSGARHLPTVVLGGVKIHAITEAQCVRHIVDELDAGYGGTAVTPNLDHLRRYRNDVNFGALVAEADLAVADGMPLVWASRLLGTPLPERVAGSNLISSLSAAAAERGKSVYLLGGAPGTAEGAAAVLTGRFPGLKIAGTYCPPVGFEDDAARMADIFQSLATARPDVVYVGLGSPKQERLIARLRPLLPGAWWLGVGISFSFLCGDVRRAPLWMQRSGLEWVHRLASEPRRLFHRYLMVGVPFASVLLGKAFVKGVPVQMRRLGRKLLRRAPALPAVIPERPGTPDARGVPPVTAPVAWPDGSAAQPCNVPSAYAPHVAPLPTAGGTPVAAPASLARLRAVVMLGGAVRPSALSLATNRSSLDLPLDERGSVLNHWLDGVADLARAAGVGGLPVRVMVNQHAPEPGTADARHYGRYRVERDLSEYRGTGGVLHDLAADYEDDDLIVVVNGRQILLDPLPSVVASLARMGGDVGLVSHEDGTPSGIMLVRCKTLRLIAPSGYVDMKEQALPQIAEKFDVRVMRRRRPTGLPVRTLEDYVLALRCHHRRRAGKPAAVDPLAEDWSPSFALVEPGAAVDPGARLHDSVVLKGATVEAGAVLVRSLVCEGAAVRRDKSAVDQIVDGHLDAKPATGRGAAAVEAIAKHAAVV